MSREWVEELYNKYYMTVFRYLLRHIDSREDAEDIMQETFLSIDRHKAEFDPSRCDELAWIYIIAKRKLYSYYRSRKISRSIDDMEDYEQPSCNYVEEAMEMMSIRNRVAGLLELLDERSRQVVVLKYFDGLEDKNIAEILNITPVNVRVIRNRAMARMRDNDNE